MTAHPATEADTQLTIDTFANDFGRWCAYIRFNPPLPGAAEQTPEENLTTQWDTVHEAARGAILDQLVQREQKTYENETQARARLTAAMSSLQLISKNADILGHIHSITLAE